MLANLTEEGVVVGLFKNSRFFRIVMTFFTALEWVDAHLTAEVFGDARNWDQVNRDAFEERED